MGTTAVHALRYPDANMADNVPYRMQLLAEDVDAKLARDTGWRVVTAQRSADWNAGILLLRRRGDAVELRIEAATRSGASGTIYNLPAGFRANEPKDGLTAGIARGVVTTAEAAPTVRRTGVTGNGVTVYNTVAGGGTAGTYYGSMTWLTTDAWPGVLPGVAATLP